jgi:hypothetical protein
MPLGLVPISLLDQRGRNNPPANFFLSPPHSLTPSSALQLVGNFRRQGLVQRDPNNYPVEKG